MSTLLKIAAGLALVIAIALGVVAFNVFRTPAEATAPIEAIPLSQSSAAAVSTTEATPAADASVAASAAATAEASEVAEASAAASTEATASTEAAASTEASAATDSSAEPIIAQIVQEESEVRFIIDEVLNNAPFTVVGTTNQVAGELAVDADDPSATRVGIIQVNARTLTTDSEFRNRAIANEILQTDQYEFITFTPTEIVGLPENGEIGQTYTFQIIGDLTVRDVTNQVTFDVTATPVSETRLEGTASTTILYADYDITIPQARSVASVDDDVRLEIDFVAVPNG